MAIKRHYEKTQDPLYKMMLHEPQMPFSRLEKIKIPTLILVGAKDMIRLRHTRAISHHIKDAKMIVFEGKNHDNYVVHETFLEPYIIEFLK
jgi:pimeloyl-ACP methyl ester carboxylesterase